MTNYKLIIFIFFCLSFLGCDRSTHSIVKNDNFKFEKKYKNIGFTFINSKILNDFDKLDQRSLNIFHKTLKKKSLVKITNPKNGNSLIAEVKSNKIVFSNFYNSVISTRIAETLGLDAKEPYIEIVLVSKDSTFIAKKTKTFDQEKSVAQKAPIDGIQIKDLKNTKKLKIKSKSKTFSYLIKVADFYYQDTALMMVERIKKETLVKNSNIIKLSKTKYRVLIGPFNDIQTLKDSFEKLNSLNFENLEILKNV